MKTHVLWQSCLVAAMGCLASGLTLAQSTVDCSSVAEDRARLKCYDEQAARQKKANAPTAATTSPANPAPAAASASPPAAATAKASPPAHSTPPAGAAAASSTPPTDFGLDADAIRKRQAAANPDAPKEPEAIVGRVKAVQTRARGEYRITLDDGQVWDETQHSSSAQAPHVGETVTIKRGMLGSYFLSHSAGLALRVKRIN